MLPQKQVILTFMNTLYHYICLFYQKYINLTTKKLNNEYDTQLPLFFQNKIRILKPHYPPTHVYNYEMNIQHNTTQLQHSSQQPIINSHQVCILYNQQPNGCVTACIPLQYIYIYIYIQQFQLFVHPCLFYMTKWLLMPKGVIKITQNLHL